jgi:hypothetical protein
LLSITCDLWPVIFSLLSTKSPKKIQKISQKNPKDKPKKGKVSKKAESKKRIFQGEVYDSKYLHSSGYHLNLQIQV